MAFSEEQRKTGAWLSGTMHLQDKDRIVSVNQDRELFKSLRKRTEAALALANGTERELEIKRLVRALNECGAFDDLPHAGTQERMLIAWYYQTQYRAPRRVRQVRPENRTKFAAAY